MTEFVQTELFSGTYGQGGIPHSAIEEKAQQSTSTVGMLDAGSSTPRNLPSVVNICMNINF